MFHSPEEWEEKAARIEAALFTLMMSAAVVVWSWLAVYFASHPYSL